MEQIIITHSDGSETPLFSRKNVSGISKATQKTALLSDDVVTVTVSSAVPLPVDIGDRIKVYGRTYTANQLPEPGKNGLRRYEYDITFEGLQYGLIDAQYKLPPDAYGDTYYSDLYGHLRVLVWNANRVQPNKWRLGSCPAEGTTDYKNLTTSSRNCLQVLQDICSEWNVEFEITPGNGFNTINIKEKAGVTHAFTLRYGRGKGLYSLKRTNVNNAGLTTRLFVYGGQDNLGQNYGHTRLCLPNTDRLTSFLEDAKAIAQYGVKENEKVYDIKPERVGEVTAIGPDEITFSDTTAGDNAMFDLNAKKPDGSTRYLLDGVAAKIKFQTGQLAGYEFDVHKYDHATRTFILNRFTDENGMVFPSATSGAFQISKGDKYIITEIQLPESYITAAENKLAEAAKKDFPAMTQPQVSYKLTLSEDFLIKTFGQEVEAEIFHVGDYINVKDEELGINKAVRIVRIERNLLKRHTYEITLSDTVTKSTTVRVLNEIDDINDVININKLADPTRARRRWMATQELLNMVFDPEGDYYSEKIKPLSIETQMLSVGAKSTQFTLLNVTFQPNYNKDPNALYISGGRLAHYAIEENIRQWVLTTATYTNLKPATAYYIYARCSTAAGDGTIILSESAITVEQEAGYYNFLVGVLNSVVTDAGGKNPGRLVSLTYGSSTINGRFLRTGRIESSGGGKCYFDLDNDEIGGVIRFVGSDGNYYDIADVQDTADRKRQVFVAQPYGPYDVGDLWLRSWTDSTGVARKDLYRCVTARASGFNVNDWAEATFYDNTQVTIDRGIITAGTVQLANGNSQSIVAGITGGENEAANETEARKVRIWAGASKANRFTAPFRVLQDGTIYATKAFIEGVITAIAGKIANWEIDGNYIQSILSSEEIAQGKTPAIRLNSDPGEILCGDSVVLDDTGLNMFSGGYTKLKIYNGSVGDYSDYILKSAANIAERKSLNTRVYIPGGGIQNPMSVAALKMSCLLGFMDKGSHICVDNFGFSLTAPSGMKSDTGKPNITVNPPCAFLRIKRDGIVVKTYSLTQSGTLTAGTYRNFQANGGTFYISAGDEGIYSLEFETNNLKCWCEKTGETEDFTISGYINGSFLRGNYERTILGNDGLLAGWKNGAMLMSNDLFMVQFGNFGIKVNTSGFQVKTRNKQYWHDLND